MKVLMLGWEFPPFFAGGVGIVCQSLSQALVRRGDDLTFAMPIGPSDACADHLRLVPAARCDERTTPYGPDLVGDVRRFADAAPALFDQIGERFDVVHAHDWTTLPAGLALRRHTGRPLVAHVHITEFDKTGGSHADPRVFAIEVEGFRGADLVIAVSHLLAARLQRSYGVDPARIRVVHNGIDRLPAPAASPARAAFVADRPVVLFLGRVTRQKGPEFFVDAARRVLDVEPEVTFVLAGVGDLREAVIERAAALGLGSRMLFPGFVDRAEAARLYAMADVFVAPSVSEPFGIVALEAMQRGLPVVLSRQSGASEVLSNALKVDHYDVDAIADMVVAALRHAPLRDELTGRAAADVARLDWDQAARLVHDVHREAIGMRP